MPLSLPNIKKCSLYIAWLQAFVATIGSLYFSEIQKLPPCLLCWYQRIFMYPLVIIIAVGMLKKDKHLPYYVLPLSIIGALIALYQYLLQLGVFPEQIAPCTIGVSCSSTDFVVLGFVTIPFLSLLAFLLITFCLGLWWVLSKRNPISQSSPTTE